MAAERRPVKKSDGPSGVVVTIFAILVVIAVVLAILALI
jgi:hypothetical protein